MLTIDVGESSQAVKENIEKHNIKRPWLLDEDRSITKAYAANGTPNHFLIDRDAIITWIRPGYADREMLFNLLKFVE